MAALSHKIEKMLSRLTLGVFLCVLVFLFALAAKTALYQSHSRSVQNLTASKVWQGKEATQHVSAGHVMQQPVAWAVACVLLLLAKPQATLERLSARPSKLKTIAVFQPSLSVRPPPFIQ